MSDIDLTYEEEEKPKKFQTKWFFPMFFQPNKALKEIAEKNYAVWLMPLCLLMLSALILVLVSAPIIAASSQNVTMPEGFEYFSPEQQEQFQNAVTTSASPVVTTIFPLVGKVLGIWISWFLLSSILHLSLTLNGSRSSNRSAMNIVAWSSLPFFIRDIVQIFAILITKQLITQPGLSGFMEIGTTGFPAYLSSLLSFVDIYLIWQFILVGIGARKISGLQAGKAWLATLIAFIVFLALKALPGLIGAQLGTLSTGGMFF
jgi:hypothetical protein